MGKIGRAIERIHVPAILAAGIHQTFFLAQYVVGRPTVKDSRSDQRFRLAISDGDEICLALVFDLHMFLKIGHQQGSRFACNLRDRGNKFAILLQRSQKAKCPSELLIGSGVFRYVHNFVLKDE